MKDLLQSLFSDKLNVGIDDSAIDLVFEDVDDPYITREDLPIQYYHLLKLSNGINGNHFRLYNLSTAIEKTHADQDDLDSSDLIVLGWIEQDLIIYNTMKVRYEIISDYPDYAPIMSFLSLEDLLRHLSGFDLDMS